MNGGNKALFVVTTLFVFFVFCWDMAWGTWYMIAGDDFSAFIHGTVMYGLGIWMFHCLRDLNKIRKKGW